MSAAVSAYFLVGPTAVGKTAVAQWLAEHHDFELVSADSMLVYRGMDIGTAKPTQAERSRVPYQGVDLVEPSEDFSVWRFREAVLGPLVASAVRGRQTLVVGGTGLYVKSLTHGLGDGPGPCSARRQHWAQVLEQQGVEALGQALRERSEAAWEALDDPHNARRLIRALERCESPAGGTGVTAWRDRPAAAPMAGLLRASEDLKSRIESRVADLYAQGLLEEARSLMDPAVQWSATARQAIGYAEAVAHLEGRCSLAEAMEKTRVRTRRLAKRQMTWFRGQARVEWIRVERDEDVRELARKVLDVWRRHGPTDIAA